MNTQFDTQFDRQVDTQGGNGNTVLKQSEEVLMHEDSFNDYRSNSSKENSTEISRRDLLERFLKATVAAGAAGLTAAGLAGCQSDNTTSDDALNGSAPQGLADGKVTASQNSDGTATVPGGGKLESGMAMPVALPDGRPALLFKTAAGEVRALSALCTHNQCTVAWESGTQKIICPCHGSVFDQSGKPEKGPATIPLPGYKVQVKGDDAVLRLKS